MGRHCPENILVGDRLDSVCLTIGELEGGCERSKRWVKTVRDMEYPIVYKAIPGLGHSGHPDAAALGFAVFEFALSQREAEKQPSVGEHPIKSYPAFVDPPFYGDVVNQEIFPRSDADVIPAGFRIPIPTDKIAGIWKRN
jgi:hypothetical protein